MKRKNKFDLSLKELKQNRVDNFIQRLYFALYENYYGSNRIVVCVNTLFTKEELDYIQKEPEILGEFLRQGWHTTIRVNKDHEDFEEENSHLFTEFTFNAIKK